MKRIAIVPVEFDGKVYDFKLYVRILLELGDHVKVEYTEKVCNEVVGTFVDTYKRHEVAKKMKLEQQEYKKRVIDSVNSWEQKQTEGVNDE